MALAYGKNMGVMIHRLWGFTPLYSNACVDTWLREARVKYALITIEYVRADWAVTTGAIFTRLK